MSLNLRIILSATLVLITFITLTAAALERAFNDSSETALRDRLTSQLYALMAAAEITDAGILMPSDELDALLGLPSSGVYAFITNQSGDTLWQSASALGVLPPRPLTLTSGEKQFNKSETDNTSFYTFAYGVNWATETKTIALTFNIATDLISFDRQINEYRTTLWSWLLAMALLLLISQAIILRWGLTPLRKVGAELNRIEAGEQEHIKDQYPQEIEHLTRNINILLQQEREQKTRYRNALGDLAHSLKTPLAVLQSGLNNLQNSPVGQTESSSAETLQEQITRMNAIVEYQLQRAATAGTTSLGKSVNVKSVTDRILESLQKVYRDKAIQLNVVITQELLFKGDEGDLMELLGNLLDNAFKWSKQRIDVIAEQQDNKIHIRILDDGPGINPGQVTQLLQRGKRADQSVAGHGIGLSIVSNIVDAYKGELFITHSEFGGAEISVVL